MGTKQEVGTAMEFKEQGNRFYSQRKYNDAIGCYTKAITKNPSMPAFFTNRALCHLKLKSWESATADCKRALELDSSLVKAHFFHGEALLESALYDEAITSLTRAHELAKEQKLNFGDEITGALRQAKKRRWTKIEEKRVQQEIELQTLLNRLLREDRDSQTSQIQKDSDSSENEISKVEDQYERKIAQVNDLFAQVDDRRKSRDVPDYLCGKISFELMRDPVITPSGITYDRKDIEEHLQRVGHFDPVTRAVLVQDQLTPNFAMKEVIDTYVEENPWAEEY